jgi:hypothetical protein
VTALLSQIISQHVEVVAFHIKLDHPDALRILDWESLSQVFAQLQFAGVCRMEFVVTNYKKMVMNSIKEKLSTYHSHGILHVTQPMAGSQGQNWQQSALRF